MPFQRRPIRVIRRSRATRTTRPTRRRRRAIRAIGGPAFHRRPIRVIRRRTRGRCRRRGRAIRPRAIGPAFHRRPVRIICWRTPASLCRRGVRSCAPRRCRSSAARGIVGSPGTPSLHRRSIRIICGSIRPTTCSRTIIGRLAPRVRTTRICCRTRRPRRTHQHRQCLRSLQRLWLLHRSQRLHAAVAEPAIVIGQIASRRLRLHVPRKRQIQHPLVDPRILQLIHVARQQSERHRSRDIHSRVFQLAVNKDRYRNQPACRRLGHISGPLIHPHRPNHLLGLRDLMHLPPGRTTRRPTRHGHTNQHHAKQKVSHRPGKRLDAIPAPKSHP